MKETTIGKGNISSGEETNLPDKKLEDIIIFDIFHCDRVSNCTSTRTRTNNVTWKDDSLRG